MTSKALHSTLLLPLALLLLCSSGYAMDDNPLLRPIALNGGELLLEAAEPLPDLDPASIQFLPAGDTLWLLLSWPTGQTPSQPDLYTLFEQDADDHAVERSRWLSTHSLELSSVDLGTGTLALALDRESPLDCLTPIWQEPALWNEDRRQFEPTSADTLLGDTIPNQPEVRESRPRGPALSLIVSHTAGEWEVADALSDRDPSSGWIAPSNSARWVLSRLGTDAPTHLEISLGPEALPTNLTLAGDYGQNVRVRLEQAGFFKVDLAALELEPGECVRVFAQTTQPRLRVRELALGGAPDADDMLDALEDACERGGLFQGVRLAHRLVAADPGFVDQALESDDACVVASAVETLQDPTIVFARATLTHHDLSRQVLLGRAMQLASPWRLLEETLLALQRNQLQVEDWIQASLEAFESPESRRLEPSDDLDRLWRGLLAFANADQPALRTLVEVLAQSQGPIWAAPEAPEDIADFQWMLQTALLLPPGNLHPTESWALAGLLHDDAATVRLVLANLARHDLGLGLQLVEAMANSDPSDHLRAAAIRTLDALGEPIVITSDSPSPNVRLALASTQQAVELAQNSPAEAVAYWQNEAWTEIRAAWLETLARAKSDAVDAAITEALPAHPQDLPLALRLWARRDTTVPDGLVQLGIARGNDPQTLIPTLALLPLAPGHCALLLELVTTLGNEHEDGPVRTELERQRAECE